MKKKILVFSSLTLLLLLSSFCKINAQGYIGETLAEIKKSANNDSDSDYPIKITVNWNNKYMLDIYSTMYCTVESPDNCFFCYFSKNGGVASKCIMSRLIPQSNIEANKVFNAFNMAYVKKDDTTWICQSNKGIWITIRMEVIEGNYCFIYEKQ